MTEVTNNRPDDELLSAYLDGELPGDEADALTARLAREPQLMRRLEAMRSADAAVRDVYATIGTTPMPAAVLDLFDKAQPDTKAENVVAFPARGIRRFFEAPMALAASVALVAGFFGAHLLRQDSVRTGPEAAFVAGTVAADSALYSLLETAPGGETRDLAGNAARVLLTFEDVNGDWCRQVTVGATDGTLHGVACRRDAGWQLETIALGDAGTPGGQFGTAAGSIPEAVEAAVDTLLGAGAPLESEEEMLIISEGWN